MIKKDDGEHNKEIKSAVYILGAGASNPDGVPLMNEFISEGMQNWDNQDDPYTIDEFLKLGKKAFLAPTGRFEIADYLDNGIGIEKVFREVVKLGDNDAEK